MVLVPRLKSFWVPSKPTSFWDFLDPYVAVGKQREVEVPKT